MDQNTKGNAVRYEQDADGIVTLTLDMPGRSMNVLNDELTEPFAEAIARIESDDSVTGVIITSGKRDFLAGADIDKVYAITDPAEAFELAEAYKAFLRRLERWEKPVVAALNGTALGGGLELALACNHRIAIDDGRAKFGLPEVKLGLLPGGGGTQRLPRLIGIQNALPLMAEGKELRADRARQLGILDDLAGDAGELMAKARAWIAANPRAVQPWDRKDYKWPGGDARHPANAQMFAIAPSIAAAKTWGNYPAVTNIQSCVFEGGIVDFDTGCRIESRYFAECVVSRQSKNMIHTLWFQLNEINKGKSRPEGFQRNELRKLGVLGAGMMGAGIAYVSAKAGIEVALLDTELANAERGKAYSEKLMDKAVQRGHATADERAELLARITPTTRYEDLSGCDLVIEAVFEDRAIKAEVTRQAEAVIPSSAVFASNTSTLPISSLARASARPEQFIGLHFFSPVDKMPLVEIIKGEKTSAATLARAFDYVQQIRKTPIVVNDSRGFYTSRVFATYVMEGLALLAEGAHPRAIEVAGMQAGMPVGPLALQDEVSLSLSYHILRQTEQDFAAEGREYVRHPGQDVIVKMVEQLDRPGKKAGRGFYDYPESGAKHLWPGLAEHFPLAATPPTQEEMMDRLMYAQANEAARCMAEGVVETAADANIGSIFGWGFAPFEGGTLQYINARGLERFVQRARELAERHGPRFAPAELLETMARDGSTFD